MKAAHRFVAGGIGAGLIVLGLVFITTGTRPQSGRADHHTDAGREYAYDRTSHVGRLARGLDETSKRGWVVASIKDDWTTVFPERRSK